MSACSAWRGCASLTAALVFAPLTRPWQPSPAPTGLDPASASGLRRLSGGDELFLLPRPRPPADFAGRGHRIRRRTIGVALIGLEARAISPPLLVAVTGTLLLIDVKWRRSDRPVPWAFLNGALFVGWLHRAWAPRVARAGAGRPASTGPRCCHGESPSSSCSPVKELPMRCRCLLGTTAAARRHRRRHLLVGHSLYLRPACHVAAAAGSSFALMLSLASGHRDIDRRHRASPNPRAVTATASASLSLVSCSVLRSISQRRS